MIASVNNIRFKCVSLPMNMYNNSRKSRQNPTKNRPMPKHDHPTKTIRGSMFMYCIGKRRKTHFT